MISPGVIDPDYEGEIKIIASSPKDILVISPGDRIAQLLIIPSLHDKFSSSTIERGSRGLGSTGVDWAMLSLNLDSRPMLKLNIQGHEFNGLLDTGADLSIISRQEWPKHWPLQQATQTLRGLGMATNPHRSAMVLDWRDPEGCVGTIQPYVLDHLPINLWGQDVLDQLGLILTNNISSNVPNIRAKQGFRKKRLGKQEQGMAAPIQIDQGMDTHGLDFQKGPLRQ